MPQYNSTRNLPMPASGGGHALAKLDRQVGKQLAVIHADALVARAEDNARHALARERVADIEALTQQGLMAATEIALVEQFCADRAPHASGRLAQIANAGTAGIARAVFDLGQGR